MKLFTRCDGCGCNLLCIHILELHTAIAQNGNGTHSCATSHTEMHPMYKDRHAHKRLCTVLPYLQQNPSSPWYHQLQIDENNKPAVDLNDLLKNTYAKDVIEKC